MIKRVFALLVCLGLLTVSALAENGYPLYIDDEAELLTAQEESLLQSAMEPLTAHGAAAFVSTYRTGNTDLLAESYFDSRISPSTAYSGVVFMVDMANREIYIFTRGAMEKAAEPFRCLLKPRSCPAMFPAEVSPREDGLSIRFDSPLRRPAPGQLAVGYDEEGFVLFAGTIQ